MKAIFFFYFVTTFLTISVTAAPSVSVSSVSDKVEQSLNWQAEWIWTKQRAGIPNTWVALRKEVTIENLSSNKNNSGSSNQEVIAYISADTKYWLWINGEMVVFEGGYTGGPSPVVNSPRVDDFAIASNKYYDQVDIKPYLKQGSNTIAALVWYYGDNGKKGTHISASKAGFIFQTNVGDTAIISDASWKAKQHQSYQQIKKAPPYRVAAWSINYDARQDMADWTDNAWYLPEFDDSQWLPAKSMHRPPRAPFYNLYPSEIPILNNYGLANCTNLPDSVFPFVSDGKKIKCKLDFNKNFTPYFDIDAQAGLQVNIDSNMRLNTIETFYTTKAGRQQFESFSWMNGRLIEYTFPKGVVVHGLKYRWTGVGSAPGHFESSDDWYTRIWQMAENTLYICARDNFMDTPDRERGLWIGDVADQASYLFYSMDKPGRDLLKKAIKVTLAFSDSETGIFAGLGPGRFRELPAQSLQFIEQGIWHYYFNTGDKETLSFAYPYVHKYLTLWGTKENGLATFRTGHWKWTDWGPQDTIDYDAIQNALYYSALVSARKMAVELGNTTHMSFYNSRIAALKQAYQKHYWQKGFYSSNPNKFKDDRANALAILFGLADTSQYQQIVDNVLLPNHFASPHFEWMVYNAMAIAGRYDDALTRMKQRYAKQVNNPALSTLAEYLPSGGTENHAWNAPSTVLSQHIAGITPTDVGWRTYQVMPNMAHMTHVQQNVPSVKGPINFDIKRTEQQITMNLTSPKMSSAVIGIPKAYFNIGHVAINGQQVWLNGKPNVAIDGVSYVGEDHKYLKFRLAAGSWSIVSRK
ncbi:alpha-L-rhamnosidase N-terminal domain-containing protein [Psychrosphaera sp. 1_MG-2023]|uniref:alpha-L-rhamnosidase-related protein n=1 Tax=Psychrosphaera sp. 1_MG-2023 TaxID=3062643 RepID=UPI0026E38DFF|nr:alpha-L-rhamnosidase N-terminal domain-containing protein [Psychrosphaera sp. 1_MG-2023]MDO6719847.1 alpha-L-rhamnosidase N-terminal domain-containing protein [Psychrosphaera sp. 1_MG-2023]